MRVVKTGAAMSLSTGKIRKITVLLSAALVLTGCSLRPQPLDSAQSAQFVAQMREALAGDAPPIEQPLDLYTAMARAIRHNQELKVSELNRLFGEAQLGLATADMLPRLVASGEVSRRSNDGTTGGLASGRTQRSGDLSFSWNILDFGVSYYRAMQASDQSLIAAEQYRRAAHAIMEETRIAFWRALALQKLDNALAAQSAGFAQALENSSRLMQAGLTDPVEALGAQRDLLLIQRDIDLQRRSLVGAQEQLRALIHYPAGVPLRLMDVPLAPLSQPAPMALAELADFALANRPELRQAAYEMRITAQDAKIAFLELFPGINLAAGALLDQNPLLIHQGWTSVAAQASWQLIRILQYPARSAALTAKADVERQKTLAFAVAVMMQGEISLARLRQAQAEFRTQGQMADVQSRLLAHSEHMASVGRIGQTNLTRERMNKVLAEARRIAAYGEVQGAYAGVLRAMGHEAVDILSAGALPVQELASRLRAADHAAFAYRPALPKRGVAHHRGEGRRS